MPSSGGVLRATSLVISPVVLLFAAVVVVVDVFPNMPDIFLLEVIYARSFLDLD